MERAVKHPGVAGERLLRRCRTPFSLETITPPTPELARGQARRLSEAQGRFRRRSRGPRGADRRRAGCDSAPRASRQHGRLRHDQSNLDDERATRRGLIAFGRAFGLAAIEDHRSAEADGVVRIEVVDQGGRLGYIPYTDRPINWHTDGYYNYHGPGQRGARDALALHAPGGAGRRQPAARSRNRLHPPARPRSPSRRSPDASRGDDDPGERRRRTAGFVRRTSVPCSSPISGARSACATPRESATSSGGTIP